MKWLIVFGFLLFAGDIFANQLGFQKIIGNPQDGVVHDLRGWGKFSEPEIWILSFQIILIATACGAVIAYHPHYLRRVASLEEMDHPKIIITYTLIGAITALLVSAQPEMGLAIFGIGGLMRFRTELQAARETGRVILSTIIGFCCGLQWWFISILLTIISWLLILGLDWKVAFRMVVKGLGKELLKESSEAYRNLLEEYGCQVSQVKLNFQKEQSSIVFKASRKIDREGLEVAFEEEIPENLRGTVDWPEEG